MNNYRDLNHCCNIDFEEFTRQAREYAHLVTLDVILGDVNELKAIDKKNGVRFYHGKTK